jgi:hypothetical protein
LPLTGRKSVGKISSIIASAYLSTLKPTMMLLDIWVYRMHS